jgi:hypothetical protein
MMQPSQEQEMQILSQKMDILDKKIQEFDLKYDHALKNPDISIEEYNNLMTAKENENNMIIQMYNEVVVLHNKLFPNDPLEAV